MTDWMLYLGFGLAAAFVVEGTWLLVGADAGKARKVRARLDALQENAGYTPQERKLLKERLLSNVPWIHRVLLSIPNLDLLALNLERAGLGVKAATIVGWSAALFVVVNLTLKLAGVPLFFAMIISGIAATGPSVYVLFKKHQRVTSFTAQLPEAVDLLVRSLKAGHSLPSGFRLIADELADPVGGEFSHVHEELNLGRDLEEALQNLRERIDTPDVRLLCSSVLIQRETGGNLVEILENLADMVRRRMAFADKLSSLTAEGRLSGLILMALPPVMVLVLTVINRPYAKMLLEPGALRYFLAASVTLQILGGLWIRKIVTVRY